MKKVIFSIFFFSLMVVGVQAQKSSCSSKSSCTAKSAAAATSSCTESSAAAAKLASMDQTIESRTCPVSGTVSYVRKSADATTGTATFVDLSYDAASNTFVNVSPVKMEGATGCGAKATSASGKSCCAGKTASTDKSCCAGKGKTASVSSTSTSEAAAAKPGGTPNKN